MLAGGIVAMGSVIYSKNEGKVSGKIAGGLVGFARGNAVEYSFNFSGDIQGDSLEGVLAGYLESQIKHCYYNKDLVSDMPCYGGVPETSRPLWCTGMTTDSLKMREFVGRFSEDCAFRYAGRNWSYVPGEYPEFKRDGFQEVFPVIFDDGQFISTGYTDYQGKLDKMKIPVSEEGHYFAGWVDGEGNPVGVDHVFTDSTVLYARYSETIEDTSLVVYSQPSDVPEFKVWNGDFQKIDKIVRKDGRLYYAIYTPAELKWYLDDSRNLSAILMNDLVLGKDSLTPTEHNLYYWYGGRTGLCDTCIFDGNHHTIYGLRHSLFDSLGANLEWYELPGGRSYAYYMSEALVKDLNIRSALVEQYAGAIAQVNLGHIRNCSVQAKPFDTTQTMGGLVYSNYGSIDSAEFIFDINRDDSRNHDYNIAGIASYNAFGASVTNAYAHGHVDIFQENNAFVRLSGIVGTGPGKMENVRNETSFNVTAYNVELAGIARATGRVVNCANTGDIKANSWGYLQRIAGIVLTNEVLVDSCSNSGNIHFAYSSSLGADSVAMAGIVALNFGGGVVKNVLNEGRILMEDISREGNYPSRYGIGGIVGLNWGLVDSTENRKPVLHECPNFYNECEYQAKENGIFDLKGVVALDFKPSGEGTAGGFKIDNIRLTNQREVKAKERPAVIKVAIKGSSDVLNPEISGGLFGINAALWDGDMLDNKNFKVQTRDFVKRINHGIVRYPGGLRADDDHWKEILDNHDWMVDTDEFLEWLKKTGSNAMFTVNFGSGTEQEAAAWVKHTNIDKKAGILYWEIGNEVYGNWHPYYEKYGKDGGTIYGKRARKFIEAMKKVDPTIKVAVLGVLEGDWNEKVLKETGDIADGLIVHHYPQHFGEENDFALLSAPQTLTAIYERLHKVVDKWTAHYKKDKKIELWLTEWNSVDFNPGPQTLSVENGLFVADYLRMLATENVDNAQYWDIHNDITPEGGDYGYLTRSGENCMNCPRPSYWAFQMASDALRGKLMKTTISGDEDALLTAYWTVKGKKNQLLLVNKSPLQRLRHQARHRRLQG